MDNEKQKIIKELYKKEKKILKEIENEKLEMEKNNK